MVLACGLAMAEIPLNTKNMQSAIIHILGLGWSLLMITSFMPDRPYELRSSPGGAKGLAGGPAAAHDDTSTSKGQLRESMRRDAGIHP